MNDDVEYDTWSEWWADTLEWLRLPSTWYRLALVFVLSTTTTAAIIEWWIV